MPKTDKVTNASKAKTNKSVPTFVYAYVFNGGVLKQNHCIVGVSAEHPETTVFNELKNYYGNDLKGAFYKCSKSMESVKEGIKTNLADSRLTDMVFNKNFSDTKKELLNITGLKQCSGTINVYSKKDDDAKDEGEDEQENSSDESEDEQQVKSKTKASKTKVVQETTEKSQSKTSKNSKKVDVESDEEEEVEVVEKKSKASKGASKEQSSKAPKKSSKSNKKIVDESDEEDAVPIKKMNKTSIELSDESDEEVEN